MREDKEILKLKIKIDNPNTNRTNTNGITTILLIKNKLGN